MSPRARDIDLRERSGHLTARDWFCELEPAINVVVGLVILLIAAQPGRLEEGAAGILHVDGPADPRIFNPVAVGTGGGGH